MIRREIIADKKRTFILIVLLLLLAVFAPLKSFISKWLLDSSSKDEVFAYLVVGIAVVLLSHIFEYLARKTFNRRITDSVQNIRNAVGKKLERVELSEKDEKMFKTIEASYTNDLRIIEEDYYHALLIHEGFFKYLLHGGRRNCGAWQLWQPDRVARLTFPYDALYEQGARSRIQTAERYRLTSKVK